MVDGKVGDMFGLPLFILDPNKMSLCVDQGTIIMSCLHCGSSAVQFFDEGKDPENPTGVKLITIISDAQEHQKVCEGP